MDILGFIINEKKLIIIPILLIIISLGYLLYASTTTGFNLAIDLKGGTEINIETTEVINIENIKILISEYNPIIRTASSLGKNILIIELDSSIDSKDIMNKLKDGGYNFEDYSIQSMGPSLGASFFQQAQLALVAAFVLMAIVIFVLFRIPLPSMYMILVATLDIVETFALSQLFGIKLSLATFAALLLLIGYSVDTDVLLTTRLLKRKDGTAQERVRGALKTGLTMSITTLAAVLVLLFVTGNDVIIQITSVLMIGLLCDIINTWAINSKLLMWYVKKREIN